MSKATVIVIVSFVVPCFIMIGWAVWYTLRNNYRMPDLNRPLLLEESKIRHGMDPKLSIAANLYWDAYYEETGAAWIEGDPPDWRWPVWDDYRHMGRPRLPAGKLSQWGVYKRQQREGSRGSHCARCKKAVHGRDGVQNHKDKNWKNNSSGNKETLCRSCHLKGHREISAAGGRASSQ